MKLTSDDIEKFASTPLAKRIAVENFLGSIDITQFMTEHLMNLEMDAQLYKWNAATVTAIHEGILRAYGAHR